MSVILKMMKVNFSGKSQYLKDAGYTMVEEEELYDTNLKDVYNNARWYLDNLDNMKSYRVSWKNYRTKSCTMPYRFTEKGRSL